MKLRFLLIPALLFLVAPEAHAGKPPKKVIDNVLGGADGLPSKPPKIPDVPAVRPKDPTQGSLPGESGKNPGLLDNLDELTNGGVPSKPTSQGFVDLREDPSILPVIVDEATDFEIKPPKPKPYKPGGVKDRQEVVIRPDRDKLTEYLNQNQALNLPELAEGTKPKITLVNHSYHEDWDSNFKIEITVGKNEYVVGFNPTEGPGRPNFSGGNVDFPGQTIVVDKDWYDNVLKGQVEDARLEGKKIQVKVGDDWIDYFDSHWPYMR